MTKKGKQVNKNNPRCPVCKSILHKNGTYSRGFSLIQRYVCKNSLCPQYRREFKIEIKGR